MPQLKSPKILSLAKVLRITDIDNAISKLDTDNTLTNSQKEKIKFDLGQERTKICHT